MDFVLTEEQQMFQKLFRDFATKEVAKVADQTDKQEEFPAKLLKRAAGQGFLGAFAPEEPYGGAGLDFTTYTLLVEAMAAECASTALTLHVHNILALRTLVKHGTEAAKEDLVPEMVAGERIGAFALTESGAGSDPTRLRTVACREGDHYVHHGHQDLGLATRAWPASTSSLPPPIRRPGAKGISAFVVPAETTGVVVGGREKTLGLRGAQIHRLYLKGVRVPAETTCWAQEGGGYKIALETLDYGRVGISAAAVGVARARRSSWRREFATRAQPVRRGHREQAGDPDVPGRRRNAGRRRRSGWCATRPGWRTRGSRSRRKPRWRSCSPAAWPAK